MPKTHTQWTPEQEELLRIYYPVASWPELLQMFSPKTRTAVYQRAQKLGLSRWNHGQEPRGKIALGLATPAEIGYAAGFFDGEGTLFLKRRNYPTTGTFCLFPIMVVVNTFEPAIDRMHELLGGTKMVTRTGTHNRKVNLYRCAVGGNAQLYLILTALRPHLTCKADRVDIILKLIELRRSKPPRTPYGQEEEALYEQFYRGSLRHKADRYANAVLSSDHGGRGHV